MSDVKKSNYPAVLSSSLSYPVNLSDNILAQYDQNALPILILLRQNLKDRQLHDPVDIPVKDHVVHIYKKEPTIYNGRLNDKFGTVFEFKDLTLPIVASMIASKLEVLGMDEVKPEVLEKPDGEMPMEVMMAEPTSPEPQLNPVPEERKPRILMHICPEGHIDLQILKSLGEKNLMKDTLEILEAVEKAQKPEDMQKDDQQQSADAGMDGDVKPTVDEEGHEYIKTTEHEGGKQYWYRDPKSGKILEKPNAPKGHSDYDMNPTIDEMNQQMSSVIKLVEQLQGEVAALKEERTKTAENDEDQEDLDSKEQEMEDKDRSGDVDSEGKDLKTANKETDERQKTSLKDGVENDEKDMETVSSSGKKDIKKSLKDKYPTLSDEKIDTLVKSYERKAELKKSLQQKYPQLGEDKINELIQKAQTMKVKTKEMVDEHKKLVNVLESPSKKDDKKEAQKQKEELQEYKKEMKKSEDDDLTEKDVKKIADKEAKEEVKERNKKLHKEQVDSKGEVKKSSRLQRMWKVFSIEMPEGLETKDDVKKAHNGATILKSRIMKQGKDDLTAENIVRNTLKEKYGEVFKSIVFFKENIQSPEVKKEIEAVEKSRKMDAFTVNEEIQIKSPQHMRELRQMDSDVRFSQPVYKSQKEDLVRQIDTGINDQVTNLVKAKSIDWSDRKDKEFSESDVKKSLNKQTQLDHMIKARTDANWNVPEWNPEKDRQLVQEVNSGVQEKVAKSKDASINKKEVDWSDMGHRLFDEEQVKKSLNGPKTKKEQERDEVVKSLWKIADGDEVKTQLINEAVKLLKSAKTKEELERMTEAQRQTALVKALEIVKSRQKPDLMKPTSAPPPPSIAGQGTTSINVPAATTIANYFRKKGDKEEEKDLKKTEDVSGTARDGQANPGDAEGGSMGAEGTVAKSLKDKYPNLSDEKIQDLIQKAYKKREDMTDVEGHGSYCETPEFFEEGFGGQESKGNWKGQEKETNLEKEAKKIQAKKKENEDTEGQDPKGGSRKDLSDRKTI